MTIRWQKRAVQSGGDPQAKLKNRQDVELATQKWVDWYNNY